MATTGIYYRITGADKHTGKNVELIFEATDEKDALRQASERGVFVLSCSPHWQAVAGATPGSAKAVGPGHSLTTTKVVLLACLALVCVWLFFGNAMQRTWKEYQKEYQVSGDCREARAFLVRQLDLWVQQKESRAHSAFCTWALADYDIKSCEKDADSVWGEQCFRAIVNLTPASRVGRPVIQWVYVVFRTSRTADWEFDSTTMILNPDASKSGEP